MIYLIYYSYTRCTKRCSCSLHDPALIVKPRRHGWWSGGCFGWMALTSTCPGFHFQCVGGRSGENKNPRNHPGFRIYTALARMDTHAEYFGGILLLLRNQNVGYAPIENNLICLRLRSVLRSKGVHPRLKVQCDKCSTFDQLQNHHVYMSPGCCMSVFACV